MDELEVGRSVGDAESGSGRVHRVHATGEVDVSTAPRLLEQIDACVADGATLVIFDASGVSFLDSSGIRAIVTASNRLEAQGGRLLIEGMRGAVQRVMEVAGLLEKYQSGEA